MIYIIVHAMVYTILTIEYVKQYTSTLIYTMIYTFVYTESNLNSLLNLHFWDITLYWYWKIMQQCSHVSSFKSRKVVTKFRHGMRGFSVCIMVYTEVRVVYTMAYTRLTYSRLTVYTNLDGIWHDMYQIFRYIELYEMVCNRVKV
jgi:hypothetical protein